MIQSIKTAVAGEPPVRSIELIGYGGKVQFGQKDDGLHIQLPDEAPGKFAYVFKIEFADGK